MSIQLSSISCSHLKMTMLLVLLMTVRLAVGAPAFATEDFEPNPPLYPLKPSGSIRLSLPSTVKRSFLSSTLGSNMVLQRDQESVIWGFAKPGTEITTELNDGKIAYMFKTTADDDGIWRQKFPPHEASLEPSTVSISASTGESAYLSNILFGDVYICGGQSNMQFSIPDNTNASAEAELANKYPHIRLFTVGQGTSSSSLIDDLQTIEQTWSVANSTSVAKFQDTKSFRYFSAVCWFFGRTVADGLGNKIPIGLVSNNWGGTSIQQWSTNSVLSKCKEVKGERDETLYNAMIHPYTIGPMAITGFTWYQGEANTKSQASADMYSCLFPAMIEAWRSLFERPKAYFGFIQLSTWCPDDALSVPELRNAQMAALNLSSGMVGYSTNADNGAGCNIHPPAKQVCAIRLGHSALALVYNKAEYMNWKSPSYSHATTAVSVSKGPNKATTVTVSVTLKDVSDKGLTLIERPHNQPFDCATFDAKSPGTCAWASLLVSDEWLNATISVSGNKMTLEAAVRTTSITNLDEEVLGSSYGWGAVPMLNVYDAGTNLPVLPWNSTLSTVSPAVQMGVNQQRMNL